MLLLYLFEVLRTERQMAKIKVLLGSVVQVFEVHSPSFDQLLLLFRSVWVRSVYPKEPISLSAVKRGIWSPSSESV
jgi:hypothetical protein